MVNGGEGLPEGGNNLPDRNPAAVDKIMVYFQLLFDPPSRVPDEYKESRARRAPKNPH